MTFREKQLEKILGKFTTNGSIEVKPKRRNIPHEKQFKKICKNLNLHLGGTNVETDIFKGLKAVIQRDFEEDFKSPRIKIFAPKIFLSKYPEVIEYEQYIKQIDELKVIYDINELRKKIENATDLGKKARMSQKLHKDIEKMKDNKFYTEIRALEKDEVVMVENLHCVKGEKAEKKVFQALEKYFSSTNEEVVVFYSFNFMGYEKDLKPEEKDFILINLTKRYIMPLEVKTNFHLQSLKKAVKQAKLYIPSKVGD